MKSLSQRAVPFTPSTSAFLGSWSPGALDLRRRRPASFAALALLLLALVVGFDLQAQLVPGQGFGGFGGAGGGNNNRSRSTTGRTYPNNGDIGDAIISVDPESRKLVVIADEETSKYISQVISNIDRPKPQVLIKVVFVEVTHSDASDIGVEGSFGKGVGGSFLTGGIATNFLASGSPATNLTAIFSPATSQTILSGGNIFGQGSAAGSTLPTAAGLYQILGQDYQVTIHAIAQAGKAKVLSRPSIVTRNNQPASILVGQSVPLITSVRYDTLGNAINGITYTDVGIILRVTPFINPDGMVEMILDPEISSVSKTDSTPLSGSSGSNAVNAPFIDKRSADTVVITPDGQTVVIGGLIQNTKAESENKIPILGDIPYLGNLFKRKFKSDQKTELLIFLTPHVIQAPTQYAAVSDFERQKVDVEKAMTEKELDKFLDSLPTQDKPAGKDKSGKKSK